MSATNGHGGAGAVHSVHAAARPLVRVILAGRTGLDQSLRTDPRVELVRATSGLLAIGEVFSPMDALTPGPCAVIVGEGADPGADAPRLVSALKTVDPRVRVLRAVNGRATGTAAPYDGFVSSSAGAQGVIDAAVGSSMPTARAGAASRGFDPGVPVPLPVPGAPEPTRSVDESLVHALMTSRDVLPIALDAVRARLGRADVLYHPGSGGGAGGVGAPVRYRDHVFGHLIASGLAAGALDEQACWLGAWLALQRQQQQLVEAAMTDDLTGAWNRRYFDHFMKAAIPQAQATRQPLTLLVFDIDDFKSYNDQFGHAAGDEILKHTVALLNSVIRAGDKVCRIGGDEFAVIFFTPSGPRDPASKPPAEVRTIAQRFQEQVRAARFPKLGREAPGRLSVSGGLATFPWDGRSAEELLAHADALACQCKQQGKGQIILGPDADRDGP